MGLPLRLVESERFSEKLESIKDSATLERIKKQVNRIHRNPLVGKPMKNVRKGTREVRIGPFRLSYAFLEKEEILVLLDVYHKDWQ